MGLSVSWVAGVGGQGRALPAADAIIGIHGGFGLYKDAVFCKKCAGVDDSGKYCLAGKRLPIRRDNGRVRAPVLR
jgi:hypothetical protein